jgi:uncharacterized protein YjcR
MTTTPQDPEPPAAIPYDARRIARAYYWRGWGVTEIARQMWLKPATVQSWKDRDGWDDDPVIRRVEDSLEMRLNQLIFKEEKSGRDLSSMRVRRSTLRHQSS